jgi:hypothetical protein
MVKLVVFMEPEEKRRFEEIGRFCCRPEQASSKIEKFCKETGLYGYNKEFVSIAVFHRDEDPCQSSAARYSVSDKLIVDPIEFAILKQDECLLASIETVSSDDLLQKLDELSERRERGQPYESLTKTVWDLRKSDSAEKLRRMLESTHNRGNHEYSEARMNRALLWSEVDAWRRCDELERSLSVENDVASDESDPGAEIANMFK